MSDARLKSIYSRWLRLEEAKQEISDDLKELFKEAKGDGYDGKAIRAAFRKVAKLEGDKAEEIREQDALVDLYIDALTRDAREAGSYAEATGREPVDANLVETVVKGVQTEIGRKALVVALDAMIEAEEAEPTVSEIEKVQPETATLRAGPQYSAVPGGEPSIPSSDDGGAKTEDRANDLPGRSDDKSVTHYSQSEQAAKSNSDEGIPAFLKRDRKPYREGCLHPEPGQCGAGGPGLCHACKKAMAEVEAA
jgi:uncharacterized protein (UPF0335 family)